MEESSDTLRSRLIKWAVISLWMYAWVPSLIQVFQQGRSTATSSLVEVASTNLSSQATKATVVLAFIFVLMSIGLSLRDTHTATLPIAMPACLLLPWAAIYLIGKFVLGGRVPDYFEFLLPAFILAVFFAKPSLQTITVLLGKLAIVTAGMSLVLGVLGVGLMPAGWHEVDDKSIIGSSVLAGPFNHSNILGLALALSLPFVLLSLAGRTRQVGVVLVTVAMVWSASRAALITSIAVLLVLFALRTGLVRQTRSVVAAAIGVASLAIFLVPLSTTDDSAFTNRGLIWRVTLYYVDEHPIFGWGASVFQDVNNEFAAVIGARAVTAHNIWLTVLAVGGWLAVVATSAALIAVARNFFGKCRFDAAPALFLFALLIMGVAEDPLRAWRLGPQSFIVWTGLCLTMCVLSSQKRPSDKPISSRTGKPLVLQSPVQ